MSEDMTYAETALTMAQLRQHNAELADTLNRRNADVLRLTQRMQELERENAELRAKLDAVPMEALRFWRDPFGGELTTERIDTAWDAITAWLDAQAVQP